MNQPEAECRNLAGVRVPILSVDPFEPGETYTVVLDLGMFDIYGSS